jgi:hypothetical protein
VAVGERFAADSYVIKPTVVEALEPQGLFWGKAPDNPVSRMAGIIFDLRVDGARYRVKAVSLVLLST